MDTQELSARINAYIKENEETIIENLAQLVAVPSVRSSAAAHAPFGPACREALNQGVKLAQQLGLNAQVEEDVVTVARLAGQSGKEIGLVAHLDVVPAGSGWNSDPFTLVQKDGWLIGRGVADDKGAAVLCLHVARFFALLCQETGKAPRHGIRVILGSDEENGMGDLPIYLARHAAPDFSFTPDGSFPVCNGEKGLYNAAFCHKQSPSDFVRHLEGGVAANVVADRAFALLKAKTAAELPAAQAGLTLSDTPQGVRLDAVGKAGHASTPQGTVNAIGLIVNYLLKNQLVSGAEQRYYQLLQALFSATDGSGLGIASDDGRFTPLTVIGGTARTENGQIVQTLDSRYPTSTNGEKLTAALRQKALEFSATFSLISNDPPFYIDPDSAPIQALLNTYNQVTGKSSRPFLMGGGTYARHLPNAVSFGMEEEGETLPDFVGAIHSANEGFSKTRYFECLKIFILAVAKLMDCDL
jgi:predicted dipeptidase